MFRLLPTSLGLRDKGRPVASVLRTVRRFASGVAFFFLAAAVQAAPFTPGNLVVYRVGDGVAALANTGTAVFLDEYTTAGVLVQTIAMPTVPSGLQRSLVCSGTATSEGFLTRSTDGQYLVLPGYDAAVGTPSLTGSTSAAFPRVIGRVDANGTIDTSTALTDAISGGNPRGAASTNGSDLWISGTSAGGGVRYAIFGATTSTSLVTTPTNLRAIGIFGGQLYVSANTGAFHLTTVGAGTPTTSGQTLTNLPGFPVTGSQYGFLFADLDAGVAGLDTLYVNDDTANFINKYSLVGGTWTANGTIALTGARGLTGTVTGSNVTLYVTAATTSTSTLRTVTDTSGYNATITGALATLATSATNTLMRGVAFVPTAAVPLPNLTVNDVAQAETNAGTTTFTFTVSLSAPAPAGGVTFDIATADGTATTADNDYVAVGPISKTILVGDSTATFDVTVNGDLIPETNQTFFVNVTNVTGANVTDGQGLGTITNDDAAPSLTVTDVTQVETNGGTTTFSFSVNLDLPAPPGGVTFDIATADNTATTANNDYVSNTMLAQTIPMGGMSFSFDVTVNGDTTPEPNETFFVNVTNLVGAILTDGQGLGTITNDDFTRIHDIQGPGAASPLAGIVTTRGIVTGRRSNGYFIQEPDASVDANPMTSEGIFVFTSSAPPASAAVGALVEVTGTITEFVPGADLLQPPVTELTLPTTTQLSTGNPLPAPFFLTTTFPDPAGGYGQLERLEGMRVAVGTLEVVAPTQGQVGEVNATATSTGVFFGVIQGVARPFREAGIQDPDPPPSGSIPPIPRFDTNPERIRIDSDAIGGTALDVSTGATITGIVGPLDYTFRTYTILPEPSSPPVVTGSMTSTAISTPAGNEFTVAGINVRRFFDTNNDPAIGEPVLTAAAFETRLAKTSKAVRENLKFPDVIGLQEVENLSALQSLATRISTDAIANAQPDPLYAAYLVEGNDVGGIDVGYLVKTAPVVGATPRVTVNSVVQEDAGELFVNPDASTELLNDRPNLRLMATVNFAGGQTSAITLVNVHLRSLNSVSATTPGSNGWLTDGERVRAKRQKQAESLANLVQTRQLANAAERILVLGDYNAFEVNDGFGHSFNVIRGAPVPDNETAVPGDGVDLVNPDLTDLATTLSATQRYSYTFDGNAQTLDHMLANAPLVSGTVRMEHPRMNADFAEVDSANAATALRISDHDPAVAFIEAFALSAPTVTSPTSSSITGTTATLGADVTADGNSPITERGVVYSETAVDSDPVIGDAFVTKVTVSGTTGLFAAGVTGLAPTTSHSFKAYAMNAIGTSYTSVATFTTTCPTITLGSLPNGNVTVLYTGSATASGGTGPYTYAVTSGTLPGGLSLTASGAGAGNVGGTPTTAGTFTFDITATDAFGPGTCTGVQSYSVVIGPEPGRDFYTLTPCRVLDTRNAVGPLGGPALVALADRTFLMAGTCGIPADAKAVSLNLAVTGPTVAGNLRLHPGGTAVPLVSSINFTAGQTRSNNAVVPLSALGELAAYLDQVSGTAHLILDVNGYFK